MPFEPITIITSRVVPLPVENIDTDRIIPARFLRAVDSTGFGQNLFYDWRYLTDGSPDPEFILNKPEGNGKILLTGRNFGCGSSREHAAWALYQFGFRVVISSGFADIFRNNALNNGLLPLEVSEIELDTLFQAYNAKPDALWSVDLPNQSLILPNQIPGGPDDSFSPSSPIGPIGFDINHFRKQCLLTGSDIIDFLAGLKPEILDFERKQKHHIA